MKIAVVGLGKMGEAIAMRLHEGGHTVFAYDVNSDARHAIAAHGVIPCNSLKEITDVAQIVWVMVPAGTITDTVINTLITDLPADAIIIDGGNSFFKDSMTRAHHALKKNIFLLDCGTSGGIKGREQGFCLMVGGARTAYDRIEPLLRAIAMPQGYRYIGSSGTGHYVKMVHNGIEYALLQAYAEGLHVIKEGSFADEKIDLAGLTNVWNHGSIIRSFILELAHDVMVHDQDLSAISGEVAQTGMGSWTSQEAHEHHIPVPTIDESLKIREWSRKTGGNYATKIVALLRNAFGGHAFNTKQKGQQ